MEVFEMSTLGRIALLATGLIVAAATHMVPVLAGIRLP
jgi:hypothetical protein